ncbi:SRPBCC family protein [Streptomyces sp. AJS327]|uniref:SRPBCC family protein n=1 Tax=Streptomyces sp. AJS327 TaxID=2545265 RepID=UPI0015DDA604|nr:SRPBCC family protein [Streptomyces sp. AJS327]MBA0053699.1 SRPBCC family protein [Streptomyces sp. AJS327]
MGSRDDGGGGGSSLGKLRDAVMGHAKARAGRLVDSAEEKISDMTAKLTETAGGGAVSRTGARVLSGESPVRAISEESGKQGGQLKEEVKEKAKGAVTHKAKEVVGMGGSGDEDGGAGKAGDKKVTNIVEVIDIGVPLRTCYDHWTQFEEFSGFMKGVVEAERSEDDELTSDWKLKIGPSNRSWQATVREQVPDERIVWSSEGEKGSTQGVVSFHDVAPGLTRIVVVVEYTPDGFVEKTANIWRAQGRRLRLDLKHFQRYVSLGAEEPPEGWRGEIRDGKVVRSHEQAMSDEDDEDDREDDG